jgi:hypothetical protein
MSRPAVSQLVHLLATRIDVVVRESESAACAIASTLYGQCDADAAVPEAARAELSAVTSAMQQFDILLQRVAFFTSLQRRLLDSTREALPELGALLHACPWESDRLWLRTAWSDAGAEACA